MTWAEVNQGVTIERCGGVTLYRRSDAEPDLILNALDTNGEVMKRSRKSEIRRVGDWVVKTSRGPAVAEAFKHTFRRSKYRRGWSAALHLERHGVSIARPIAFVERGAFGIILGNAMVSEYLDGCQDVEHYADEVIVPNNNSDEAVGYLLRVANAVNALCGSGAYHMDLAGKNILTRDGQAFYFVDLEGVRLGEAYTDERRMSNHVQLYDSFCDRWGDDVLQPFIARMLPNTEDLDSWMARVRERQAVRRARTEAIWRAQGRIPS